MTEQVCIRVVQWKVGSCIHLHLHLCIFLPYAVRVMAIVGCRHPIPDFCAGGDSITVVGLSVV